MSTAHEWLAAVAEWAGALGSGMRSVSTTGALMRLGLYGFVSSMLICGGALAAGLAGQAGAVIVFTIFILGRGLYGAFGSAWHPQHQVVDCFRGHQSRQ